MDVYISYIVSIVCSLISGFASYFIARKQCKSDLEKIKKTYELDIEKERVKFEQEIEKLKMTQEYEMNLKQKEFENQLGGNIVNSFVSEMIKTPEVKNQIIKGMNKGKRKR